MPRYSDLLACATALFLVRLCCTSVQAKTVFGGPSHVCAKTESYNVTMNVTESVPYIVKDPYRCLRNLKLKCYRDKIELRSVTKKKVVVLNRTVEECCEGYVRSTNGADCTPAACRSCEHGVCVSPNVCNCDENYSGPYCNHTCPSGKFGKSCTENCRCANRSPCDPLDGRCKCSAGWTGIDCSEKTCPPGNCDLDHVTGEFKCRPGYTGPACQLICSPFSYGQGCQNSCDCEHGVCHHVTGECHCYSGWTGSNCAEQSCSCQNGGVCRSAAVDGDGGVCDCKPGFVGHKCSKKCSPPYYGENCTKKCDCLADNFVCDAVIGCVCKQGLHTGEHCNVSSTSSMRPFISSTFAKENSSGSFVGMSVIVVVLIATIMTLFLYYRKRVATLKAAIDNVQYEADRKDAKHDLNKNQRQPFGNRVYSYAQTSTSPGTAEERSPNNNGQMRISHHSPRSHTKAEGSPSSLMNDCSLYGCGSLSSDRPFPNKTDAARNDSDAYGDGLDYSKTESIYAEIDVGYSEDFSEFLDSTSSSRTVFAF